MDPFAHARPNWSQSSLSERSGPLPLAATAPVLRVYEEAVQDPTIECSNLDALYSQAQLEDTDRYDARILREDFCSTAIIADTWLGFDSRNKSQGVDIDLLALQATRRRLSDRDPGYVQLLQSPGFSGNNTTQVLSLEPSEPQYQKANQDHETLSGPSTWSSGAATARFDRKRNKKLEKSAKKAVAKASKTADSASSALPMTEARLTLLHSDVLDLPLPAPSPPSSSTLASALDPPDVIASLNYAMAYFHDRATLLRYLTMAKNTLRPKTGVFVTDMFGGPLNGEIYPDQEETWSRFRDETGFGRDGGDGCKQTVLLADQKLSRPVYKDGAVDDEEMLEVTAAPAPNDRGSRAEWPRGKLKLVRKGTEHGGFEYWREDGPIDYMTNRFRMSLSFRFSDASWLRDVFHYDFRVWSIKELIEAMEEAGFVRVRVHILPRIDDHNNDDDENNSQSSSSRSASPAPEAILADDDLDNMLASMSDLMKKTEQQERTKPVYRDVKPGEKVFASKSFGTYIIACAP